MAIGAGSIVVYLGANTKQLETAKQEYSSFVNHINRQTKKLTNQLAAVENSMNKVSKKTMTLSEKAVKLASRFIGIGSSLRIVGQQATRYFTIPIALAIGASTKQFMAFEASLAKVVGLVGVASTKVEAWSSQILDLSVIVGKKATELAEALYFITSAGIRGSAAIDILTLSAKASVAGLGEVAMIADIVTSAVNAYGRENLSAAEATDILVKTVREGKAEADKIGKSMGMVLPIAAKMGVTFDQVGAALRRILGAFIKPAKQSEKVMENMGGSFEKLRQLIKEKGLLRALTDIDSLTQIYGEHLMARVMPNIRAFTGGSNIEYNIKIFESLKDSAGALDEAFAAMSRTLQQQWNKTTAQMNTTLIKIGKTMKEITIPFLEQVSEKLSDVSDWFETLTSTQKRSVAKWTAIIAAIGPVLLMLGMLSSSLGAIINIGIPVVALLVKLAKGIWGVGVALAAAGPAAGNFIGSLGAFLLNPLVLALTALAAVLVVVYINMDKVTASQKALNEITKKTTASIVKEEIRIQKLLNIMNSQYSTMQQKENALQSLHTISEVYLGDITLEAIETGKATAAIDEYVKSVGKKAKAQAAANQLLKLQEKRFQMIQEGTDVDYTSFADKIAASMASGGSVFEYNKLIAAKEQKRFQQALDETEAAINSIQSVIDETKGDLTDIDKKYQYIVKNVKNVADIEGDKLETVKSYAAEVLRSNNVVIEAWRKQIEIRLGGDKKYNILKEKLDKARVAGEKEAVIKNIEFELEERRKAANILAWEGVQKAKQQNEALKPIIEEFKKLYSIDLTKMDVISPAQVNAISEMNAKTADLVQYNMDAGESVLELKKALLGNYESTYKALQKIAREYNVSDEAFKMLGDLIRKTRAEIEALEKSAKKAKIALDPLWNMPKATALKVDFELGMEKALRNSKLYGETIDFVNKQISITKTYLAGMENLSFLNEEDMENMKTANILLKALIKWQKKYNEEHKLAEKTIKNYSTKLEDLKWKMDLLGDSAELLNEKLRIQQQILTTLLNKDKKTIEPNKWVEDIANARKDIQATKNELAILELQIGGNLTMVDQLGQSFYSLGSILKDLGLDGLDEFGKGLMRIGRILGNIVQLIDAVKTITLIFKAVTGVLTASTLAETVATTGLASAKAASAVAGAVASGSAFPFPYNLVAMATSLKATMAGLAMMPVAAGMAKTANLKEGGIIPNGYPNDTFRTNLSSNEAVIPLERLPQLMADAGVGGGNNQKVEFFIEGRYLKGILADADAVSKAY